jgi:hypothetical protein
MAKKRVFLDECLGREELGHLFGTKAHVYSARDLGVTGKEDIRVIDGAVAKKCLIVTVNKDFLDYYRNHPRRRQGTFFYGLIFLRPSKTLSRSQQLKKALRETAWSETRDHDDLVTVYADGRSFHERLCHPECAEEFARTSDGQKPK